MVKNNLDKYVCISHAKDMPCDVGEYHLVSNWPTDVARVLDRIKESK